MVFLNFCICLFYGINQEAYQNQASACGRSKNTSQVTKEETKKYGKVNGRTIGEPKLSEKAAKYYEQLHNLLSVTLAIINI